MEGREEGGEKGGEGEEGREGEEGGEGEEGVGERERRGERRGEREDINRLNGGYASQRVIQLLHCLSYLHVGVIVITCPCASITSQRQVSQCKSDSRRTLTLRPAYPN